MQRPTILDGSKPSPPPPPTDEIVIDLTTSETIIDIETLRMDVQKRVTIMEDSTTQRKKKKIPLSQWFADKNPHKFPYLTYKVIEDSVFMDRHSRYFPLEKPIMLPEHVTRENTWSIRQGESSAAWMALRNGEISAFPNPKISASSLPKWLGLFLKRATLFFGEKQYYSQALSEWENEVVLCKKADLAFVRYRLRWGNLHEKNGLETLFQCFPDPDYQLELYEIGTYIREIEPGLDFLASPDGLFKFTMWKGRSITFDGTVEIKSSPCPWAYKKTKDAKGFYFLEDAEPPEHMIYYYIPQVMMQMYTAKKSYALFIAWTPDNGSFVCMMRYNQEYVDLMIEILLFVRKKYHRQSNVKVYEDPYEQISKKYEQFLRMTKEIQSKVTVWDTPDNIDMDFYDPENPLKPSPFEDTWGPFPEKTDAPKK